MVFNGFMTRQDCWDWGFWFAEAAGSLCSILSGIAELLASSSRRILRIHGRLHFGSGTSAWLGTTSTGQFRPESTMLDFRLHDGDQACLLPQGRIARQTVSIGFDTAPAGNVITDGKHGAPFREPCAHLQILRQSLTQTIKPFVDLLSRMTCQVLFSHVHLDAGDDACFGKNQLKRTSIGCRIVSS